MTQEEYEQKKRDIKIKIFENLTSYKNWLAFIAFCGSAYLAYLQGGWEGFAYLLAGISGASVQIVSKTRQNIKANDNKMLIESYKIEKAEVK